GKDVVAFDTEFVPGIQRQSLRDEIIRLHISPGSRDCARVGNQLASWSRLVDAENFRGERIEAVGGDLIVGERLAGHSPAGVRGLGTEVINGNHLAGLVDPLAEVAVVHLRDGHSSGCRRGAERGAEALRGYKEG